MTYLRGPFLSPRPRKADDPEEIGSPAHQRLMLLELASELENWPVRNIVYRHALDGVAREIMQLASHRETGDAAP